MGHAHACRCADGRLSPFSRRATNWCCRARRRAPIRSSAQTRSASPPWWPRPAATPRFLGIAARHARQPRTITSPAPPMPTFIVTLGGASVGDHDLVGPVLREHGPVARLLEDRHAAGQTADVRHARWPARAGPARQSRVVADHRAPVPGAARCAPCSACRPTPQQSRRHARPWRSAANGPRAHYMRARIVAAAADGAIDVMPVRSQDSSLLVAARRRPMCLIVRADRGAGRAVGSGESVPILPLDI